MFDEIWRHSRMRSGGRLPEALFMFFLSDSKVAKVCYSQYQGSIYCAPSFFSSPLVLVASLQLDGFVSEAVRFVRRTLAGSVRLGFQIGVPRSKGV